MPVFTRPDAEIYYEVHGSGYPLLLAPNLEIQKDWRGPTHLAESIRRVTDFLTRNTPS